MCIEDLPRSENVVPFRRNREVLSDDQIIIAAIDRALLEKVSTTKLRQARVRAMNLFHAGTQMNDALRRAIAWAVSTTDEGKLPPSAA